MIHKAATSRSESGHTLMELVAAMVCSAMLLAGLGSVMLIARQVAFTPSASVRRTEVAEVTSEITDELQFAMLITQQLPHALEFVVADRDSDGAAEKIRYEWSGTSGDPLVKTVNGGTPKNVLESVEQFDATCVVKLATTNLTTSTDTAEGVLLSNDNVQSGVDLDVTNTRHVAQQVNCAAFVGVPADAICWNATKVQFWGRDNSSADATLLVQLRRAGGAYAGPTSEVLGQVSIPESILGSETWHNAVLSAPVRGLALHRKYALVLAGAGGDAARLAYNDNASSGVFDSTNAGASWQLISPRQIYYRIYGTYTRPGATYSVTRNIASHVHLVLQSGSQAHARIDTSVPLANVPELLSAYWRADFERNPTTIDADRDGTPDWTMAAGATFDPATLINGRWHAVGALETRPLNNFHKITIVEAACRNTTVGGNGAVLRISADRQSGLHAPLIVYVKLQSDGTQTLTLSGRSSDLNTVALCTQPRLSSGLVRFRLTIVPEHNIVNLNVNDVDLGTFVYPVYAPSALDRFVTLFADTSLAEFDYVDVRVADN